MLATQQNVVTSDLLRAHAFFQYPTFLFFLIDYKLGLLWGNAELSGLLGFGLPTRTGVPKATDGDLAAAVAAMHAKSHGANRIFKAHPPGEYGEDMLPASCQRRQKRPLPLSSRRGW